MAGKRTFVRLHVRSTKNVVTAAARIVVEYGVISKGVLPINKTAPAAHIKVRPYPDRSVLDHAFLFELPSFFTSGTVKITARVNPGFVVPETNYANNDITTTVKFESVPGPSLVMYALTYKSGDYIYPVPGNDVKLMLKWIASAFPVNDIEFWIRQHGFSKHPSSCKKVNAFLKAERNWDLAHGKDNVPGWARYYGMVPDGGGFMRGCSGTMPSSVASGPTGSDSRGWDFDGSYGDWYGGHELAHAFGRYHAQYCGAKDGKSYPYSQGRISKTLSGPTALYGFNAARLQVYGPDWRDVMTYCPYQWISDFTHHGLMNYLQKCMLVDYKFPDWMREAACSAGLQAGAAASAGDRLLVVGSIDPATNEVELEPLFVIPVDGEVPGPIAGDYAIVLRDADGAVLARYPFTPSTGAAGRGSAAPDETERDVEVLFIDEMVPFVEGTVRVDIEGPGGALLTTVQAGAAAPQVTVQSPNGGEVFTGATVPVSWSASDEDGDPLVFHVEYSRDNGTSWQSVARGLTETSIELDASTIPGGAQALIRVWASDGIHTASDVSDAPFTVPNHLPQVAIVAPANGAVFGAEQTVAFEADGYDVEVGALSGARMLWRSDRDGVLGNGRTLSAAELSVGVHTVTAEANDGEGGVASAAIEIEIVADPAEVPPPPDELKVEPLLLSLEPSAGRSNARLFVDNPAGNPLRWRASASERWVQLSHAEGLTPNEITVGIVDDAGLAGGDHAASITVTDDVSGNMVVIPLAASIGPGCTGDCDGDGNVTVDELVTGVNIALGTFSDEPCPVFDANLDGEVTVDELVMAVNNALNGCG
ncbi:MAG: hypothetical protein HY699_24660 [Deltaproteobacteria bacterium]|nr:hypothetical protein [Deltaproteobacteria bacterium]